MAIDIVFPLKIENPASGGSQTDAYPTEINENQDYIATRGISFQGNPAIVMDDSVDGNIEATSMQSIFFNYNFISSTTSLTVPVNTQYACFQSLTVNGSLIVNGDIIIFT